jgi:hypothetical protein
MAELTSQLLLEKSHLLTLHLIFLKTNDSQRSEVPIYREMTKNKLCSRL